MANNFINKKVDLSTTDLTTAVFAVGTGYRVVRSVVVKSAFLFIKLLAIIVKRN